MNLKTAFVFPMVLFAGPAATGFWSPAKAEAEDGVNDRRATNNPAGFSWQSVTIGRGLLPL